jgi:hypothetical protein
MEMMVTRGDLLAQAALLSLTAPDTSGSERDFHLAVSAVYRTLAEMAAAPEVSRVLAPAA